MLYRRLAALAIAAFGLASGCSDDGPWKEGDRCNLKQMAYADGTECLGASLVRCEAGRITVRGCANTCSVADNVAICSEERDVSHGGGQGGGGGNVSRPDTGNGGGGGGGGTDARPAVNCGEVTSAGRCSGTELEYCDNGSLVTKDCAVRSLVCGASGDIYDCVQPQGGQQRPGRPSLDGDIGCGDVTEAGICEGDVLKYCGADGNLVTEECADGCRVASGKFAVCYEPCGDIDGNGVCAGGSTLKYCDGDLLLTETCVDGCWSYEATGYSQCHIGCGGLGVGDSACFDEHTLRFCEEGYGLVQYSCDKGCADYEDDKGMFSNCIP